jgi:hypothetical protein
MKKWPRGMTGTSWLAGVYLIAQMLIVIIACSGCAALERPEERLWQALHLVDVAQTYRIGEGPCYKEAGLLTRHLLGEKPKVAGVVAWGAGRAVGHALISDTLLRFDMPRAYKWWQFASFYSTAGAVNNNIEIGIRIGSPNKARPEYGCNDRPATLEPL